MRLKITSLALSLFSAFIFPVIAFAQQPVEAAAETKGLDQQINDAFAPVANAWEALIFTPVFGVPFVLILLVFGAFFFTIAFGFANIRLFPLAINVVRGKYDDVEEGGDPVDVENLNIVEGDIVDTIRQEGVHGEVTHFQALATAVSGTVGLGNIGGVAVAIAMGGPGATFWMILCGLLGMSTKFVECTLGVKYRDIENRIVYGGPMYYLSKGFAELGLKSVGKILAVIFAVMCIGGSFGGGNMFQANQATIQLTSMMKLEGGAIKTIIGIIIAAIVAIVIIGGIKRIASVTEKVVPFMAIIYVVAAVIIILANITFLPTA
ncbi:MAG: alanine:cation symporter family protein, partial [Acidobacteriota bacterium]|nr:alanine:cation symporter family protein [Acidobacteriota bacterium]